MTKTFGDIFESAIAHALKRYAKDGITKREDIFNKIVKRFEAQGIYIALLKKGIIKDDFNIYINEVLDKQLNNKKELT